MILEEIGAYLQANGEGVVNTTLFFSGLPDSPDLAASFWEYGGEAPAHVKDQAGAVYEIPRFQVITRAKNYSQARAWAERIYRLLDGFSGGIEGVHYASIRALQSPFFLDRDEKNRPRIVCNYQVRKELSPLS